MADVRTVRILKVEQLSSAEALDVGCERKREFKGDFKVFGERGERPGFESLSVTQSVTLGTQLNHFGHTALTPCFQLYNGIPYLLSFRWI